MPDMFRKLLLKWDNDCDLVVTRIRPTLVPVCDDLPPLPPKACIQMVYVASLMAVREYQEVATMQEKDQEEGGLR